MDRSVVVARPPVADRLVLLFHGVGASAASLVPLARLIAGRCPDAMVVSVDAAFPSSFGSGRQWFSVAGITEENRMARIAGSMPEFERTVRAWQDESRVGPEQTTLVGFSQGAIMALESSQGAELAHRIVAISGRFAQPPRQAPAGVVFRFVHGEDDAVIDASFSRQAAGILRSLGADATAQVVPGLGHGIDERAARLVLDALDAAR